MTTESMPFPPFPQESSFGNEEEKEQRKKDEILAPYKYHIGQGLREMGYTHPEDISPQVEKEIMNSLNRGAKEMPLVLGSALIKIKEPEIISAARTMFDIEEKPKEAGKWIKERYDELISQMAKYLAEKFPDVEIKPSVWERIAGKKVLENENPIVGEYVRRLRKKLGK